MTAIEGPRELKAIAEYAHEFVKTYMTKMNTPEPPMVFFTKQGIMIPDRRTSKTRQGSFNGFSR